MKCETFGKLNEFILSAANDIAEEQPDCRNIDWSLPVIKEFDLYFHNFVEDELLPAAKAISINKGITKPAGKFDKEAPKSFKRKQKRTDNLFNRTFGN